jgi:hypothetical protein
VRRMRWVWRVRGVTAGAVPLSVARGAAAVGLASTRNARDALADTVAAGA